MVGFDTSLVHYKEINITGSSGGSPWDVARTLELIITAGEIDAGDHIAAPSAILPMPRSSCK